MLFSPFLQRINLQDTTPLQSLRLYCPRLVIHLVSAINLISLAFLFFFLFSVEYIIISPSSSFHLLLSLNLRSNIHYSQNIFIYLFFQLLVFHIFFILPILNAHLFFSLNTLLLLTFFLYSSLVFFVLFLFYCCLLFFFFSSFFLFHFVFFFLLLLPIVI